MVPEGSVLSPQNLKPNQFNSHYYGLPQDMCHFYAVTYRYDFEVISSYVIFL